VVTILKEAKKEVIVEKKVCKLKNLILVFLIFQRAKIILELKLPKFTRKFQFKLLIFLNKMMSHNPNNLMLPVLMLSRNFKI